MIESFGSFSFLQSHIELQNYNDNLGEVLTRTTKFPGADGGLDEFGRGRSPTEVGTIWFTFIMEAQNRDQMQGFRDAINALEDQGIQLLVYNPAHPSLPRRWAYARINNIRMEQSPARHTDLWQPVQIIFHLPFPFFQTDGGRSFWDRNVNWNNGLLWTPAGLPHQRILSGTTTTFSQNNTGVVTLQPQLVINTRGGTITGPITIDRRIDGYVHDSITLDASLGTHETFIIDCKNHRLKGRTVLFPTPYNLFTYKNPHWMRLLPGANAIRVQVAGVTGSPELNLVHSNHYR